MAALIGCGQRSVIHSRQNSNRSSRNEFQDFHRSFRARQLYRASPRPPRKPQPSATSCRPTSSGREPAAGCALTQRVVNADERDDDMAAYAKQGSPNGRTYAGSVGKFCDVYHWRSSASARRELHVAPDVLYRYTYGTTDWNRSDIITDVDVPNRKPSAQTIIAELSDAGIDRWYPAKHLEHVTKPLAEVGCTALPVELHSKRQQQLQRQQQQQQTLAVRSSGSRMNTPRKLGRAVRTSGHLYRRVRTSIELLHPSTESTGSGSPRTIPKTPTGGGSISGYQRERTRRGKSVAMLDYLQDSGWSSLRRSQTAPAAALQSGQKEPSSADAYLQYVEQQKGGAKPFCRLMTSRQTIGADPPPAKTGTPTANIRAPPVTPRSWDSDVKNMRGFSGRDTATTSRAGGIASARGAPVSGGNRPEVGSAAHSGRRRKDFSASESSTEKSASAQPNDGRPFEDVMTNENELASNTRSVMSASKREMLTVDLRSAVGDL